jgi:hypothetical protein
MNDIDQQIDQLRTKLRRIAGHKEHTPGEIKAMNAIIAKIYHLGLLAGEPPIDEIFAAFKSESQAGNLEGSET